MRNKFITIVLLAFILINLAQIISATKFPNAEIHFFWQEGCPHCASEKVFLSELQQEYPNITVKNYSIYEPENLVVLKELFDEYNLSKEELKGVPMTFVEGKYFSGFDEQIGNQIRNYIETGTLQKENVIALPLIGEVDLEKYSLVGLSIILGLVDGFNVCSLGALIFVLGIVLGLGSRKKIIVVGSFFVLTVSFIYWLLILVWYKLFSFAARYFPYMNLAVGAISIAGGIYYLVQFIKFSKHGPTCETSKGTMITKFREGIKDIIKHPKSALVMILAIVAFAALITMMEFPCSAMIPAAYTSTLSTRNLSTIAYIFYTIIYIVFYMLDEIIVFLTAAISSKIWLSSAKFIVWSTFIGALILILLGGYYVYLFFF